MPKRMKSALALVPASKAKKAKSSIAKKTKMKKNKAKNTAMKGKRNKNKKTRPTKSRTKKSKKERRVVPMGRRAPVSMHTAAPGMQPPPIVLNRSVSSDFRTQYVAINPKTGERIVMGGATASLSHPMACTPGERGTPMNPAQYCTYAANNFNKFVKTKLDSLDDDEDSSSSS